MIKITRKEFKEDAVFRQLHDAIKRNHKVANHTIKVLSENHHVKNFCQEARHFALLPGKNQLHLHYDVTSWYQKPGRVVIRIESICIYDSFMEYEVARKEALYNHPESEGLNLN